MNDDVKLYEGNCQLKKVVGKEFAMGELSTAEVMACQGILDRASQQFFVRGVEDVAALEALIASTAEDVAFFVQAGSHAHNLRGQSEILGFTLITTISRQMIDSIEHSDLPPKKKRQLVVRITELLRIAFDHCIRDAGGKQGEEVLKLLDSYLGAHRV